MPTVIAFLERAAVALILAVAALDPAPARADDGFPFGLEMTLDVSRQPGSKRIPTLEIGDAGEAVLQTVIFVPGPLEDRNCPPARAQADDELVAALSEAASWKRQGDFVTFIGAKTLRYRINTN